MNNKKFNPNVLNVLCGVERDWKHPNGYYRVLQLSHEDVMRIYLFSKYQKMKGNDRVIIQKWVKRSPGLIKFTLGFEVNKDEIIEGSTFDRLSIGFNKNRDNDSIPKYHGREFHRPVEPCFKIRHKYKQQPNPDFDITKDEVAPKQPKPRKRNLKKFDQALARSIKEEPETETQPPIVQDDSVQEPQEPTKPAFDPEDDSIYE